MIQMALLIDRDSAFLETESSVLTQAGFLCHSAQTGRDGIELACRQCPDVILLGILLPDRDGFQVCRSLRSHQETQYTPIFFLSMLDRDRYIQRGFEAGASDYLMKPVHWEELLARIRFHLLASQVGVALEYQKTRTQYWQTKYTTLRDYVLYWLEEFGMNDPNSFQTAVDAFKNILIQQTFLLHDKNVREAARALQISTRSFRRHLKHTSVAKSASVSSNSVRC